MQTLDVVLNYFEIAVLFGSMLYFPTMFVLFVIKSEAEKTQAIKVFSLESKVEELQLNVAQVRAHIEAIEAQEEEEIKPSATDSEFTLEDTTALVDTIEERAFVESMKLSQEEPVFKVQPTRYAAAEIDDQSFSIVVPIDEPEQMEEPATNNTELPTVERSTLKIWSGRKQEKLVPVDSLPLSVPEHIKRRRWRNKDVILLGDLETIAQII